MGLSIGIVGLPNVGKSTVFNALTGAQNAAVANYPFCTIQPNKAVVPVPDLRLERLAELVHVSRIIHATIEFFDIAGLVKGASQGEGLGNQFLGHIRNTDAILHVVRCFEDPNVVHVSAQLDPRADIETINLELVLADLQQLDRKIERLSSEVKGDRKLQSMIELAQALRMHLNAGLPVQAFDAGSRVDLMQMLNQEMNFLTSKPVIYAANLDEGSLMEENPHVEMVRQIAAQNGSQMVTLSARLESEIQGLPEEEQHEMLALAGIDESGLGQVIRTGFEVLGLISFFTRNEKEVRAWEVPRGTPAPKAAGTIHTDFERGFIRAEVIPFDVFLNYGSDAAVKAAGKMQLEGKEYTIQDGDVIFFRFNV
jgi:GTP-binding protein YchF